MTLLLLLLLLGLWVPAYADVSAPEARTWHFDADHPDQLPPKFVIGTFFDGRPGGSLERHHHAEGLEPAERLRAASGERR